MFNDSHFRDNTATIFNSLVFSSVLNGYCVTFNKIFTKCVMQEARKTHLCFPVKVMKAFSASLIFLMEVLVRCVFVILVNGYV